VITNVPTMIGKMLAHEAEHGRADLSSLRLVLSAGEKLPEALQRQWLERCGVEILDGIGSAELFHIYISNRPGAVRVGSLGQAVPGYDCRVVDESGAELPRDTVGRLHVRGESSALCYWQAHEKSKETFAGDLVITGDLFNEDAQGYFWYEGRVDELIKVGGICGAPQIEAAAGAPAVAEWSGGGRGGHGEARAFVVARAGRAPADPPGHALTRAAGVGQGAPRRAQVPALRRVPGGAAAQRSRQGGPQGAQGAAGLTTAVWRAAGAARILSPCPTARTTSPSWLSPTWPRWSLAPAAARPSCPWARPRRTGRTCRWTPT
jgi:hypothetical protein